MLLQMRMSLRLESNKIRFKYWLILIRKKDAAMRTLYLLIMINIGLLLTSCASLNDEHPVDRLQKNPQSTQTTTKKSSSYIPPSTCAPVKKNPLSVSFYQKGASLQHTYKVLGVKSVSKYNKAGIKRQEACIRDNMRKIAANMGGDAVIEENRTNKVVTGTIVSFEENKQSNKV